MNLKIGNTDINTKEELFLPNLNNFLNLKEFDVILIPKNYKGNFRHEKYTVGKKEKLIEVMPELKDLDFDKYCVVLGESLASLYLKRIGSPFSFQVVESLKISPEEYSQLIENWKMPLSCSLEEYFHDFYMHGMGVSLIPKSFISWWSEFKNILPETHKMIMATVVEWTTIKSTSDATEALFQPGSWQDLYYFIRSPNLKIEQIDEVFKLYPTEAFIQEWKSLKF